MFGVRCVTNERGMPGERSPQMYTPQLIATAMPAAHSLQIVPRSSRRIPPS